jgi:hypothetical protein
MPAFEWIGRRIPCLDGIDSGSIADVESVHVDPGVAGCRLLGPENRQGLNCVIRAEGHLWDEYLLPFATARSIGIEAAGQAIDTHICLPVPVAALPRYLVRCRSSPLPNSQI